jgi:hypothetical protein
MGIDIYAEWDGQTEDEKQAQYTGYSVQHGHTGYLREAYHGEPYATRILVKEAFASDEGAAHIPAKVMRARLPEVIQAAMERERVVYGNSAAQKTDPVIKSFTDFVELCEEKEKQTGKPCKIIASY